MPGKSSLPTISVIVPNFNHGSFLHQRIQGILNQTYQDFELILMDDRSTDESREILETYRNHPKTAHLVFNETNSGSPFLQWEKGMQLAKGRYIWIAESDDWCEPSFLETLVPWLEADPEVRIAYCQSLCLDEQGKIKWVSSIPGWSRYSKGRSLLRRFMLKGNSIFNASMAVFQGRPA
ncbi:MAG: glycosyltransferase family 2 protein [Saprospirales bacterium]|nr:glycosyltransferase family 2 protein [Saprospirales bacterium]